jgi:hypothetical protein
MYLKQYHIIEKDPLELDINRSGNDHFIKNLMKSDVGKKLNYNPVNVKQVFLVCGSLSIKFFKLNNNESNSATYF